MRANNISLPKLSAMSMVLANSWTFSRLRALDGPHRDGEVRRAMKRKRERLNAIPDDQILLKRQKQTHLVAKSAKLQKTRAGRAQRLAVVEETVQVLDATDLDTQLVACGGATKQLAFLKRQLNALWHKHRDPAGGKKPTVYMFSQKKIKFTVPQLTSNLLQIGPLPAPCAHLA
jgi:hypothetical protein